jgi:integrase
MAEKHYHSHLIRSYSCTNTEKIYLPWSRTNKQSWRHDEFRSRPLIEELGKRRLDQIGVIQIEAYKQKRLKAKTYRKTLLSPASVNRELELLSGIFTYALKCKILIPNPCQDVRRLDEDNERNRYLSRDEELRLMNQLTGRRAHLHSIVLLAIHSGMRKSELLNLRWPNVDFAREIIHVMNSRRERTKGKKSRPIPMNPVAREILLSLHAHNMSKHPANEFVFLNPQTRKPIQEVKTAFTSALEDAKIEDFVFHDLRRTAATRLGDLGANAYQIAAIMGHCDIETSQIYAQATDETLRRLMDNLGKPEAVPAKVPPQEERRPLLTAVNS